MEDKIYFYLPGLAENFDINMLLVLRMDECPEHYRDNIQIGAIYGAPPGGKWNGGRHCLGYITDTDMAKIIGFFNHFNIPVRYTWTNPVLLPEDYEDEYCRMATDLAHTGMNEMLVNDLELEAILRKDYPKYSFISSTTKRLTDLQDVAQELNKDYKLVVLDYDLNNKWELLEQITQPEKCEILVNAVCTPNCPRRKRHYEIIGRMQRGELPVGCEEEQEFYSCPAYGRHLSQIRKLPTFISWDMIINDYVPKGFHHFKIEGRTVDAPYYLDTLIEYLVKDEYKEEEREHLYQGLLLNCYAPNIPVHYE